MQFPAMLSLFPFICNVLTVFPALQRFVLEVYLDLKLGTSCHLESLPKKLFNVFKAFIYPCDIRFVAH